MKFIGALTANATGCVLHNQQVETRFPRSILHIVTCIVTLDT